MTTCPKHPGATLLRVISNDGEWFCPECQSTVVPEVSGKVMRAKYRKNNMQKMHNAKSDAQCRTVALSEADVKRAVDALCEFAQNQGKGIYVRLFTGDLLMRDETGRVISRVRGCATGTPDRLWIAICHVPMVSPTNGSVIGWFSASLVTWLELKRPKDGRQSPEQVDFQARVEAQGCRYRLVTDVSQVQEIIG